MTRVMIMGPGVICSLVCLLMFASIGDCLRGVPGRDYPIHNSATDSSFSCKGRVPGAYYADPSLDCQAYHICTTRRRGLGRSSFLCPNGTIFNQQRLICDWWFSASCSPDEDQYSGSEGVARGRGRSNQVDVERPRSRKMPTSKELPRSRGASKKAGLVSSKKLTTKKIPQITKKSPSSKSGSGSRSPGISRGLSKIGDQLGNSVRGKKRRKGGSKAKGKASGSRSRKDGRLNFKQTPKPNQLSQRAQVDGGFNESKGSGGSDRSGSRSAPALNPAPPLPITGKKEEQVVEYDISLPELADYDLVEYTVDLDAPSLGPRPQPSPALLSALSP